MKIKNFIIVSCLFLFSCSNGSSDTPTPAPTPKINMNRFLLAISPSNNNQSKVYMVHKNKIIKIEKEKGLATIAGQDKNGYLNGNVKDALFGEIGGIDVDNQDTIYVTDSTNNVVRIIKDNNVSTLNLKINNKPYNLSSPQGIAILKDNLYISDTNHHVIIKSDKQGNANILAGQYNKVGYADGVGINALFNKPWGIVVDTTTNKLMVAGSENDIIREVSEDGTVTTIIGQYHKDEVKDGIGTQATLKNPRDLVSDRQHRVAVMPFGEVGENDPDEFRVIDVIDDKVITIDEDNLSSINETKLHKIKDNNTQLYPSVCVSNTSYASYARALFIAEDPIMGFAFGAVVNVFGLAIGLPIYLDIWGTPTIKNSYVYDSDALKDRYDEHIRTTDLVEKNGDYYIVMKTNAHVNCLAGFTRGF